jgi:hypothetical protein
LARWSIPQLNRPGSASGTREDVAAGVLDDCVAVPGDDPVGVRADGWIAGFGAWLVACSRASGVSTGAGLRQSQWPGNHFEENGIMATDTEM